MPFPLLLPLLMGGASALGGALSNRGQTSKSTSTSTTSTSLSPGASGLNDQLLQMIRGRLSAPSALPAGYQEGGIKSINHVFDLLNQTKQANLTARGLGDSPVAAIGTDHARGGEIARFQSGLPLVARGLENENMDFASRLFALQPRNTTTTSSGTNTQPGNQLGGAMDGLASMLGFLLSQGAFGKSGKTGHGGLFGVND